MSRSTSSFGCLMSIVLVAAAIYVGVVLGRPWLRFTQYQDEIRTEARFATSLPDSVIKTRILARADTLRLPPEAKRLTIRRRGSPGTITISADYDVSVHFLFLGTKVLHFHARAEQPL